MVDGNPGQANMTLSDPPLQRWQRLGRLLEPAPPADSSWWASHAANPVALSRGPGRVHVYFSARDAAQRSHLARVSIERSGPGWRLAGPVEGPLFGPGPRGAFDADGVTVGSILPAGDTLRAYYLGWTVGRGVPFTNFIGLAVSRDGGRSFERHGRAPIVGRSEANPYTVGYPWVLAQETGYRMWFGSHLAWGPADRPMEHVIQEATSPDGRTWTPSDRVVVPLRGADDPAEFAVSRPVVQPEPDGVLSMWYARRRPRYELGYARSTDAGATWTRHDDALQLVGAPEPWESTEQTYPCVFDDGGERFLLYNGDGYGRTGFGLARLRR